MGNESPSWEYDGGQGNPPNAATAMTPHVRTELAPSAALTGVVMLADDGGVVAMDGLGHLRAKIGELVVYLPLAVGRLACERPVSAGQDRRR
jgi:hypothetical protein